MSDTNLPDALVHKIGAIARLSGVPTPTLRIWEIKQRLRNPKKLCL